jgi:CheY-like chemotaxis protein
MTSTPVLVLVVEDEPLIQDMVEVALADGGFTTEMASSGEAAVGLLDQKAADYKALITDIDLEPGKATGWDDARRARELVPDMPVVYTTGHSAAEWTSQGVPNSLLVQKPFAPAQIVTAVSQLLTAATTAASVTSPAQA